MGKRVARIQDCSPAPSAVSAARESSGYTGRTFAMTIEQLLQRATDQHRAGDLQSAARLYGEVLAAVPAHAVATFRLGLLELQRGRADQALDLIGRVTAAAPANHRHQMGLAQCFSALGRWPEAAEAYRAAVRLDPASADALLGLGTALQAGHDWSGASGAYEAALRLQADSPEAHNNLGICHQAAGEHAQAEAAYRRALALRPAFAQAMANLGVLLQHTARPVESIALLRAALSLEPEVGSHAVNLGSSLCQAGEHEEAVRVLDGRLSAAPADADAAYNLGNALLGLGRSREAIECYRHALSLRPGNADALSNLGNAYKQAGEPGAAMAAYETALDAQPHSLGAINNLGCLLRTLGRVDEAEQMFRRGLAIDPGHPSLYNNLGNILKDAGAIGEAIACYRRSLELDPSDSSTHSNLAYALSFVETDGLAILAECRRWDARFAAPLRAQLQRHRNERAAHRRLTIGYLSPDFRDHCQSLFTIPLLSHHDHAAHEVVCYSCAEQTDAVSERIAGYADRWRDVRFLKDAAIAEQIRADRVDILVDLTMHMSNGRPLVFARKPAPVQIAWLAYPGTTGIGTLDVRFTDPRLETSHTLAHYSERSVELADTFWCYDPLARQPDVNPLPALTRGQLSLGCLNNPCKLSDDTLRLWGRVMATLPSARLVLMAPAGRHRERLRDRLGAHGVASSRVEFLAYRPRAEYLRSYHDLDLGLDTYPYNGHTTSLDSLWMGVPVVSRTGPTCVGRAGRSQLFHVALDELAVDTDDAFVAAAVSLARDLPRLATLRRELRPRLLSSPLADGGRFAHSVEAAYRAIWERYCASAV
jgi:protein O-GlcNAc transferase